MTVVYESFFGFKEKPFNITPDPKYLYLSEQHQEAIAHLLYGIQERGGFVVVTGEIGTGKTTLCRYLINEMDDRTEGAVILNPNLSEIELLKSINQDFGIISVGQTKKELIDELNRFLLEERLRGKNMVLVIDEAQNLHPAVLEQVRMLSNLETEKEKLIQIILVGQPQLKKLLARPELRQLDQRITARYHLNPLNRKETFEYIQHRLDIAADDEKVFFEPAAMKYIYKVANGIPRLINVICDRSLLGAFAAGQGSPIPKKIVKQAVREVIGRRHSFGSKLPSISFSPRIFSYAFTLAFLALVGWYAFRTFSIYEASGTNSKYTELIPDLPFGEDPTTASSFPEKRVAEASQNVESPASQPAAANTGSTEEKIRQESKAELINLLLSKDYEASRLSAAKNLLALWGKYPEVTVEQADSFYLLAMSQQMRCSEFWTNFDGLRSSNLPCILEMFIPQELSPRYVVLARLNSTTGQIFYADAEPADVRLDVLDEFWLRRAFVFWRDFEQVKENLRFGDSGSQVAWLQGGLQSLGLYQGQLSGEFDEQTEEAVLKFQRQSGLLLDGIVGPRTKLILYANLKQYPVPRLNGESI
ncbi:MAG: AAA family ATPase [Candidatus Abyssobacteria bacterium SURF_5]|uniref:AAA family ATPase n=1 Tax=Abyssobacteria bacterium (strain SURF_5) TaxID=2093360 RepID=A0A3A4NMG2_ABYX5|nr:MAG: AAA family ATPase [Candidatus Abyssubacteria bacterium SURF_5]